MKKLKKMRRLRESQAVVMCVGKEPMSRADVRDVLFCKRAVQKALIKLGFRPVTVYIERKNFRKPASIIERIAAHKPYCVFNLFEGLGYNPFKEAEFAALLEEASISFTGSQSCSLRVCLNKSKTKGILRAQGVRVPAGRFVRSIKDLNIKKMNFPLFLKPCKEDASLGIDGDSLVTDEIALIEVLHKKLKEFSRGMVIEEFISGNEYNVGMLGDYPYTPVGISTIDYSQYTDALPFLTYNSKWKKDSPEYAIMPAPDAPITRRLRKRIISICRAAGKALGCRGYFRVDVRESQGRIYVLDVNPNPDISPDSGFARQAAHKGWGYEGLVARIMAARNK